MIALTACAGFLGTGCYTQLYTQGHLERAGSGYPQYAQAPATLAADPAPAAGDSAAGDSAAARLDGAEGDTLYRPGTVIVNNYYRESPVYRGYAISAWDYPSVTFGFYSARYRDYYGPYWWDDPWYRSRPRSGYHGGHYHGGHGHHGGNYGGSPGSGSSGPYKSDKRLFVDPPDQHPGKGRRAAPPSESYAPPAQKTGNSEPAPSPGGSGSASGSSGSSSGASQEESRPSKGRRR